MTHVLAFVGVGAVVIVTPGPDTALTIRNAVLGGRGGGVETAAGVAVGQACWTLAASAGLAAVVAESRPAFETLRFAGAAYLVYLGVVTLLSRGEPHRASDRGRGFFRQGVLSNLANPKMAVFFVSLLPQFATSFVGLVALGLVFCAMTFVWLSAYAFVVARVGDFVLRTRVRRTVDRVTGAVLIALGIRIAAER